VNTINGKQTSAENTETSTGSSKNDLVAHLASSKIYQDYSRSFSEMTGLPLTLRTAESWRLPYQGCRNANRFCTLMTQKSAACAACLRTQETLSETATHEAQAVMCPSGLTEMAVPVRLGDRLIGFLQTGQVFRKSPSEAQFGRVAKQAAGWGVEATNGDLRAAYFNTRVLTAKEPEAINNLLTVFAQHLSLVSNQVVIQQTNPEPPMIARAKQFIREHQDEKLSLPQVAKAVNASTFYFCKMFRKVTGINFTDYVCRTRIEKAKNLTLNPNLRISEIAYEVGFQSLTHFNRVFKKITGDSPTEYRSRLALA